MRLAQTPTVTRRLGAAIAATSLAAVLALTTIAPTVAASADERSPAEEVLAPAVGEGCFYVFLALLIGTSPAPGVNEVLVPQEALPVFAPLLDACGLVPAAEEWRICGLDRAWIDYANDNSPNPWVTAPVGLVVDTFAGAERASGDPDNKRAKVIDQVLSCEDRRALDDFDEFDGGTVAPLPTPTPPSAQPVPTATFTPPTDVVPVVRSGAARPTRTATDDTATTDSDDEAEVALPAPPTAAELVSTAEPVLAGSMSTLDLVAAALLGIGAMYGLNRRLFGRLAIVPAAVDADDEN